MKFNFLPKIIFFLFLVGCKKSNSKSLVFSSVEIVSILEDSLLNIRAMELNTKELVAVSSIGDVYLYDLKSKNLSKTRFANDTLNIRSMALIDNNIFTLSIGNPALLYKNSELVYSENHPNVFYDSMAFWNSEEGIAMGDPTENCLSILITRDGGKNWQKIPCDQLPNSIDGEAAFAASDTNIKTLGDMVWIASGGMASRILFSSDKGKSWKIFNTPIVQGTPTTGMYSIDFYDSKNGFAIGGDYTQPKANLNTKITTNDGGKSWQLVGNGQAPGYRSCIKYVPNSEAKSLVAVGFEGIDYSADCGHTWLSLSKEGFYTIRFLNDSVAFAAGKGRISMLNFKADYSKD